MVHTVYMYEFIVVQYYETEMTVTIVKGLLILQVRLNDNAILVNCNRNVRVVSNFIMFEESSKQRSK